ncbi:MAG: flavodoxin family protein [Candidatus Omnitrophica bacterium]|nr:flavodoxin family protein [Candidatus Omnitrophota bacterium]
MGKNILIISASPKKDGNTSLLVEWVAAAARSKGADVEILNAGTMAFKVSGCTACRACQKLKDYICVIEDEGKLVLQKMISAHVIVMATPLYFYGPSAQLKVIFDRMFSLYKWDNAAGTMRTPLKGKMLALVLSGFEDVGLDVVEKPFRMTADYTGMMFESLLVPNAGVSGEIRNKPGVKDLATAFGKKIA